MKKFTRFAAVASLAVGLLSTGHNAYAKVQPADLVISAVDTVVGPKGDEMVRGFVKNNGKGAAGPFTISFAGTGGTKLTETITINGLAPGAETRFSHTPGITTSCDWARTITVDSGKQVYESDENNNVKLLQDAYCPRPDLMVNLDLGYADAAGNEYVSAYITNYGSAIAAPSIVHVDGQGPDFTLQIPAINPGATYILKDLAPEPCNYDLYVTVDRDDIVDEYNETNNYDYNHSENDLCNS